MMLVLADTSIWVAHFRQTNPALQRMLAADQVLCHPLILVELACGTPPAPRDQTLNDLRRLCQATLATTDEILALIESERLHDRGCGAVDMALLAATRLTPTALLWTADRKLQALAGRMGIAFSPG